MITITNNKIYYSEYQLSTSSSLDGVDIISNDEITNFLSEYVELGESVTFKRLFDIASENNDKFNNIFFSALGGHKLDPFFQEIENNQSELTGIEYIEVYWYCDKYNNELTICPALQGTSEKFGYHALDFISLNNLKNCNIKINKSIEIIDYNNIENADYDHIKIDLGEKSFTLFELYNAIFYEIAFHGGPLDKQETYKEIEESITQEDLDDLHNEKEINLSFEDIIKNIEENDEYLVVYNGFRDRVDESRITTLKNLDKLKKCILEKLKIYDKISNSNRALKFKYKQLTDIEFNIQLLYGEKENIIYHQFWETPKCICPKIDNLEIYPSKNPIFNPKCPIHKK